MINRLRVRRSSLLSGRLVWLLTVEYASRVYRWSTSPIEVVDADGVSHPYDGGLSLDGWTEDIAVSTSIPEPQSVTVEVDWPGSVAEIIQSGHPLDVATAELSCLVEGEALEDRVIVALGDVETPEYGADTEPVALTISGARYEDRAIIPAGTARVSAETVLTAYDDGEEGRYYPIVWGSPGLLSDGTVVPATPAIVIDRQNLSQEAQLLRIAGHPCAAPSVTIFDSEGTSEVFVVTSTVDELGQDVTDVDVSGAATIDLTLQEFFVGWHNGHGLTEVSGFGSLLGYMLQRSTLRIDWIRARRVIREIETYQTAGYLEDAASPWDVIQDVILPVVPVQFASSTSGIYPVFRRASLSHRDATAALVAGPGLVRDGRVAYTQQRREMASEVRFDFGRDLILSLFSRAISHTGKHLIPGGGEVSSYHARMAYSARGAGSLALESEDVWDDDTAHLLATLALRNASSGGARRVTYTGHVSDLGYLSAGQIITITDAEISLNSQLSRIVSVTSGADGTASVVVEIDDDPARDTM